MDTAPQPSGAPPAPLLHVSDGWLTLVVDTGPVSELPPPQVILRRLKVAFNKVKTNTEEATSEMVQRQEDVCREATHTEGQSVWVADHTTPGWWQTEAGTEL